MKENFKKQKSRLGPILVFVLSFMMAWTMIPGFFLANAAYAAAGDTPAHAKLLADNHDGTYKLALSVTGEAERKPNNTNVIIILDNSGSMAENTGNTEETYTPSTRNWSDMYGSYDGENFFPIYRHGSGRWWDPYYYTTGQSSSSTVYEGTRYLKQEANQSRMDAAKQAVDSLASTLLGYNGGNNPSDTFELALIKFGTTASVVRTPTTHYDTGSDQFKTALDSVTANGGGTNWEDALHDAGNINFGDNDQTFVIFVSDGNPTFRNTKGNYGDLPRADNSQWSNNNTYNLMRGDDYFYDSDGVYGLGSDDSSRPNYSATSMQRCYDNALDDAQALVNKVGNNNFFTIGAYGDVSRMQSLTTAAGAPSGNYYSAENTAALQEAIASIMQQIEMAGFAEVELADPTTQNVAISGGTVDLLEIDRTSFKYYRSGGTDSDGNVKYNQ